MSLVFFAFFVKRNARLIYRTGGAAGGLVPAHLRDVAAGLAGVRTVPVPACGGKQVGARRQGATGGVVQHAQVREVLSTDEIKNIKNVLTRTECARRYQIVWGFVQYAFIQYA